MVRVQDKAQKLHEQLHGSTFHIKLAKEAMKKVRDAEAAMQAKTAEEAEALRQGIAWPDTLETWLACITTCDSCTGCCTCQDCGRLLRMLLKQSCSQVLYSLNTFIGFADQ